MNRQYADRIRKVTRPSDKKIVVEMREIVKNLHDGEKLLPGADQMLLEMYEVAENTLLNIERRL